MRAETLAQARLKKFTGEGLTNWFVCYIVNHISNELMNKEAGDAD